MDSGGFPFKASCCFIEFLDNAFEQVSVSPYLHKVGLAVGAPSSLVTMNLLHMLARRTWREYGALNYYLYEDCSVFDLVNCDPEKSLRMRIYWFRPSDRVCDCQLSE